MYQILLLLSLFGLFYILTGGDLPEKDTVKEYAKKFGLPALSAVVFFIATTFLFKTPLAGLAWGVLGYFLPGWIIRTIEEKRNETHRQTLRDFITAAAGLYAAGQVTPDVIRTAKARLKEPWATEFEYMLSEEKMTNKTFPRIFEELWQKYGLSELKAIAAIIEASSRAGGPLAAARGFKRLGQALRQRERQKTERAKSLIEVQIAAGIVIILLIVGLIADIAFWGDLYNTFGGKVALGLASWLVVGMIFMARKVSRSDDLV